MTILLKDMDILVFLDLAFLDQVRLLFMGKMSGWSINWFKKFGGVSFSFKLLDQWTILVMAGIQDGWQHVKVEAWPNQIDQGSVFQVSLFNNRATTDILWFLVMADIQDGWSKMATKGPLS